MTVKRTAGGYGSGDGSSLERKSIRNPEEWTRGDEPMTGHQASYVRKLLQEAGRSVDSLDESLTKANAATLIDELQQETGRVTGEESS